MGELLALSQQVELRLIYQDDTPFGSALGRFERELQARCAPIAQARSEQGLVALLASESVWLARVRELLAPLYEGPETLVEACLYPPPAQVVPRALAIRTPDRTVAIDLSQAALVPELAQWLGDWRRPSVAPRSDVARQLWDALVGLGALGPVAPTVPVTGDVTFVGHACVAVHGAASTVLFDPFLRSRSARYPASYQPLGHAELRPDAVFVTHSHPDHFDPGSLLGLDADTPIFVPEVPRESLLAVDMAARLRQIGFRAVRELAWHAEVQVGDVRVVALPFHGEQPTTDDVLHPELRNHGNLYWAEARGRRYALLADAGVDRDGTVDQTATAARRRLGGADVVFGGYRAFALYPLNYLFTSVGRYLLFVPRALWGVRQRIMNDADGLLDAAERFGADTVVPYADGGAPWYWEAGLGPRLDGACASNAHRDPPPEVVAACAARRSSSSEGLHPSPVTVRVLRPGQGLVGHTVVAHPDAAWPFAGAVVG